jgi:ADP-heptose:LPS heptosyltransferase
MVKYLIIRFSSIGDIVLTTPIVRCLKNQVKDSEIHYLTKERFKTVIEANPYIDKVHTLGNNFNKVLSDLKKEDFDYVIDLHHNIRTLRVKNHLNRISLSFNKLNIQKWLMVNFKINKLPDIHIVDRYFETVNLFSVKNDNKGLDFFIKKDDEVLISQFIPGLKTPFYIIVIGGGHYTKQIPLIKILKLIESVNSPVILIGGKEDIAKAAEIEKLINKEIFNLTGKLNIGQSASLIKQSELIVTPDTGMMHIASALGKDIFSIWGNTIPKFGMYPYFPGKISKIFEVADLGCRPCSKIGYKKCPKKHFDCMMKIDYENLANKINKQFSETVGNN